MKLTCNQIDKVFQTRHCDVAALHKVTFTANAGNFICIVGPSGCGKSTLMKIVAGLLEPTSGSVRFSTQAAPHCAMVFQAHGLFPWMTVLQNIAVGLTRQAISPRERNVLSNTQIQTMGLEGFANAYPHELSIGMQQRVGIARAFISDAPVLLMDEPFAALDAQTKLVLREELMRIWSKTGKLVLYITHDVEEAILLGDRVLVMSERPGRILEDITVPLARPRDMLGSDHPEFRELKWHIWKMLESEVKRSLSI